MGSRRKPADERTQKRGRSSSEQEKARARILRELEELGIEISSDQILREEFRHLAKPIDETD